MSFQERAKLGFGALIQTIASYLNDGAQTSGNLYAAFRQFLFAFS